MGWKRAIPFALCIPVAAWMPAKMAANDGTFPETYAIGVSKREGVLGQHACDNESGEGRISLPDDFFFP